MAGVVGSNPTRPIESSVQSPKYVKISFQQSSSALRYQMRDLYNRRKRLADWNYEKSIVERTIQYLKDRTEYFDDYFPTEI
jgi:hypothetical protein